MFTKLRSILQSLYKRWRLLAIIGYLPVAAAQLVTAQVPAQPDELAREAFFHIEPGSLESALLQFSRQARIQVVFRVKVADVTVTAIDGRRNARDVLSALLNETGLKFAVVGKTVTVYTDPKRRPAMTTPLGDEPTAPIKGAPDTRPPRGDSDQ